MPFGDNFIKQIWGHSFASGFIVLSIPLLLDRLSRKTSSTKFTYLCLFINLAALYLSNSRSAIIALLVSLFLIKTKSSPLSVIKKTTIIISVIVLVLVSLMSVYLPSSTTKKNFTGNRFEYWRESLQGIVRYPVFGFGPGNFAIINDKYQKAPQSRTDNPHNFILELLSEDGIIFSFIFFFWIYQGLKFQAGHNHLGFNLAITLAVNSLFDMTLSFPALMIIFIYLVFHDYPEFINNKAQLPSRLNYLLITILLSLFFLSKTSSDFLYLTRQYRLSILFDPFNINSRLEYLSQLHSHQARKAEINRIIYLFRDDPVIYDRLIAVTPLPEAEPYYYRLIELSSNPSLDNYISLLNFYEAHLDSYHTQSLQLLRQINSRYDKKDINWDVIIRISSAAYKTANTYWQLGDTSTALELYKIPVKYFPEYTPYQIELANVYWSLDRQDLAVRQLSVECQKARSSNIVCRDFLNGINSGVKHFTQPGHMITN